MQQVLNQVRNVMLAHPRGPKFSSHPNDPDPAILAQALDNLKVQVYLMSETSGLGLDVTLNSLAATQIALIQLIHTHGLGSQFEHQLSVAITQLQIGEEPNLTLTTPESNPFK